MNIGMNGVLVLHHSFSFFFFVFLPSPYSFTTFHFFFFTQSRGYPYTQRFSSFLFLDTHHFNGMTASISVLRAESSDSALYECVMAMVVNVRLDELA